MMAGWLSAWWRQIKGETGGDPWNDDPSIVAARDRQHEVGVSDLATARRLEAEFWRRRIEDRRVHHDGA